MTAAPTTNVAAEIVGGFIQALMTAGEDGAELYLTTQFPFLADPILQTLLDWLVSSLGDALQTQLINSSTALVIALQTSSEQSSIVAASTALQIAQESGDATAIATAKANALKAFQALGMWDGVYNTPSGPATV